MTFVLHMFKTVGVIGQGASFGELALITLKPRAATIYCMEDTDCAVMNKKSYEKAVGKGEKKKNQEKIDFLRNFRIFSHMSDNGLLRLCYYLKEINVNNGHVMYKRG